MQLIVYQLKISSVLKCIKYLSLQFSFSSNAAASSFNYSVSCNVQQSLQGPTTNILKNWSTKTQGAMFQKQALIVPSETKKVSLKLTIPPSFTDKIHFLFITLYHKHTSLLGNRA